MRQLRDLLRLKYEAGLTHRAIGQACGVGLGTVSAYLARAAAAGVTWPLPDDLDDAALAARLFACPADPDPRGTGRCRRGRTCTRNSNGPGSPCTCCGRSYRGAHPTGFVYSQFCERYRRWARVLKPSMRQVHRAGEKLFVGFSGKRPSLVDATTGEVVPVALFVGVLGASGLIYAEATRRKYLASWVGAHVRMVESVAETS